LFFGAYKKELLFNEPQMVDGKQLAQVMWILVFGIFSLVVGVESYNYIKHTSVLLPDKKAKNLERMQLANTILVAFGLALAGLMLMKTMAS